MPWNILWEVAECANKDLNVRGKLDFSWPSESVEKALAKKREEWRNIFKNPETSALHEKQKMVVQQRVQPATMRVFSCIS